MEYEKRGPLKGCRYSNRLRDGPRRDSHRKNV